MNKLRDFYSYSGINIQEPKIKACIEKGMSIFYDLDQVKFRPATEKYLKEDVFVTLNDDFSIDLEPLLVEFQPDLFPRTTSQQITYSVTDKLIESIIQKFGNDEIGLRKGLTSKS